MLAPSHQGRTRKFSPQLCGPVLSAGVGGMALRCALGAGRCTAGPHSPLSRSEGSNLTPAHHFQDFRFKTYAPVAFRYFRELFGIRPDDYLVSVSVSLPCCPAGRRTLGLQSLHTLA